MRLEPLKEDDLYVGENPLEFILVPKCPLLGGFTVIEMLRNKTDLFHGSTQLLADM